MLPVQGNKIVVSNFYGRGYGDHLKPIVEELLRRENGLDIVWLTADEAAAKSLPAGVRAASYAPRSRIRELCTAKVWLDNNRKGARFKKPGQWYLQTWHGFALKRIERDVEQTLPAGYAAYAARDSAQTDLIVSNSALMTKIYRESFWYEGEVAEFGSPRNDILFAPAGDVKQKVCAALGIPGAAFSGAVCADFSCRWEHGRLLCGLCPAAARTAAAFRRRLGRLGPTASACDAAGAGAAPGRRHNV